MTSLSEAREQVYQTWVDNVPSGLDSWTFENEEGFDEPDEPLLDDERLSVL